ncbi:hypothetical protein ABW21_db0209787 [Orbilia brochopaga]|nr:hypothetical protein ABW21_db0209787 [Drechslerella brochopaga]
MAEEMFDWPQEEPLASIDAGDEQWQMFVNLDRQEAIRYPIKIGENGIFNMDMLREEQFAVRKAFCEFMLPSDLRAFSKRK